MDPGRDRSVVVVGAEPAGLATSRELLACGVDHVVLERGQIGKSWRRYYDGLVLHTGRHLSSLPGVPFCRSDPMFIPRGRFIRYLEDYADQLDLPVRLGVDVRAARWTGDRWELGTTDGPWRAPVLIVASGIAASPVIPAIPGRTRSLVGPDTRSTTSGPRPSPAVGCWWCVPGTLAAKSPPNSPPKRHSCHE